MRKIDSLEYTSQHHLEGSWGSSPLGECHAVMDFYVNGELEHADHGMIEWVISSSNDGEDEIVEHIGLWFAAMELTDYDGVMSFPEEAIDLLERNGFTVGEDYRD